MGTADVGSFTLKGGKGGGGVGPLKLLFAEQQVVNNASRGIITEFFTH